MKRELQVLRNSSARSRATRTALGILAGAALTLAISGTARADVSIFTNSGTPQTPYFSSPAGTFGVKFRADVSGSVTALRFYKGAGNNGTHYGLLYDSQGTQLVKATYTNETASGWQQVDLPTPIQISANTTYTVAYFSPSGFAVTPGTFASSGVDSPPLHALQSGVDGYNSTYYYDYTPHFPIYSSGGNNYWADVVFLPPSAADLTISKSHIGNFAPGATGQYTITVSNHGVGPTDGSTVTVTDALPAGLSPNSVVGTALAFPWSCTTVSNTVTCKTSEILAAGSSYGPIILTVNVAPNAVSVTNIVTVSGGGDSNPHNNQASDPTTIGSPGGTLSILTNTPGPQYQWLNAPSATLGLKFYSDVKGTVTGLRFYKGPGNSGTHIGLLYDSNGTQVAKATFTNETSSGWQDVSLSTPVPIKANRLYIVALWSNTGYAVTFEAFNSAGVDNTPLHALQAGVAGPNGVYSPGVYPQLPLTDADGNNYWVDVDFVPTI